MTKRYTDVMVDIETLSTDPHAIVLSAAGVLFNLDDEDTWKTVGDEARCFHVQFPVKPQEKLDRHKSDGTVNWWMRQSAEARDRVMAALDIEDDGTLLKARFKEFARFSSQANHIWGNGCNFDNVILRNLGDDVGININPFYTDQDLRTLARLANTGKLGQPSDMVAHDALDDAKYQVLCAQHYWRALHGGTAGTAAD